MYLYSNNTKASAIKYEYTTVSFADTQAWVLVCKTGKYHLLHRTIVRI